ncbi:MAG TPA: non-heme iron oxygenase ferredoxin subunit [Actinomycetota bacterium]|nr:non-heme iron oxygenase ferredoxin subunit [Actinomycetota bacterium]
MAKVRVCKADDLKPGMALRVETDEEPVAVFNVDGDFYAIADTCSHEESSLSEGYVDEDIVECAKHGAMFHIPTGEVRSLPATRNVRVFGTVVEDGDLYVEA